MTCSGRAWWADTEDYGADALPAIQSAVISECRVRLWKLMNAAGLANVAYVDTDGLIVTTGGSRRLRNIQAQHDLWGLREKRSGNDLAVYGPRQLIWNGQARWAGAPRNLRQIGETVWAGERWESLAGAIDNNRIATVVTWPTVWKPEAADNRRAHISRHSTEALRVEVG